MNGERGAVEMTAGGAPGAPWRGTVRRRMEGRKGSVLGFDQQPGLSSPKYQLWARGASAGWIFMARVLTPASTAHPQVTRSCSPELLQRLSFKGSCEKGGGGMGQTGKPGKVLFGFVFILLGFSSCLCFLSVGPRKLSWEG